ncbi:hypothetical protein N7457_005413 [Penicillium paradoxum]|uniref:uncharacterized protein n=1 Tax=Penicillium paradoxum TaxID=176176 RepID=UPI00254837E4|nr:uncharacterized protein N7457_005413 [Penicillium paradoxum]KAJ5780253.1 hypothetical protein N7457_005413 [Penicillium paradoxum]
MEHSDPKVNMDTPYIPEVIHAKMFSALQSALTEDPDSGSQSARSGIGIDKAQQALGVPIEKVWIP